MPNASKGLSNWTEKEPSGLSVVGRLKFLAKDSLLYGGAAAINKAFALITFPLIARHFSVDEYGLIDFFSAVATLLSILLIFGQDSAVARFFYEYKEEPIRKQIVTQSFVVQLILLCIVLPLFYYATYSEAVVCLIHAESRAPMLLRLVVIQIPFLVLINFSQNLLKWTFSRLRFLTISLGSVVMNVLFLLVAIFVFDISVQGVFIVRILTQAFFGLLGILFVKDWLAFPKEWRYFKEMFPFAVPYGVICALGAFVPVLERSLVNSILGAETLGLFAAGTKIAMLAAIFAQAFQTAWGPFSLSLHKEPDVVRTYNLVLKGFALFMCLMVLFLSLSARPVLKLLAGDRYSAAALIVFPLSLGVAVQAIGWISEIGIGLSKKTYFSLASYTLYFFATMGGVWFLGNLWGFFGVALGVLFGHACKSLLTSWISYRVYPLEWDFKTPLLIITATFFGGLLGAFTTATCGNLIGTLTFTCIALLLLILSWFKALTAYERSRVRGILSRFVPGFAKG
jgi:O-antigen/teichoic acid export membrane protein